MKFYFDENLSPNICNALNELEKKDKHNECIYIPSILAKGATDEAIFAKLGSEKAVYITQDSDFKKLQAISEIAKQKNIGIIQYTSTTNTNYWSIAQTFCKYWFVIRKKCPRQRMPFFFRLTSRSFNNVGL